MSDLLVERQRAKRWTELHPIGPTTQGHLRRHRSGIGEAQPEHATRKELPVPMDKLTRELRLAETARAGRRRDLDLPNRGCAVHVERPGEIVQTVGASHKQGLSGMAQSALSP